MSISRLNGREGKFLWLRGTNGKPTIRIKIKKRWVPNRTFSKLIDYFPEQQESFYLNV